MGNAELIQSTGISVVYEPESCPPLVDILIVHGLQGHPYRTWACAKGPKKSAAPASSRPDILGEGKDKKRNPLRLLGSWRKRESSKNAPSDVPPEPILTAPTDGNQAEASSIFWPADLLPKECPNARILVYGYDTKITKYMTGAINKNGIFSYGKDLLFALSRERKLDLPIIFVAHSLGGIVVKEALARSSTSTETWHRNVIESTAAVMFLGTPHRGSPDLAALGEWARSVVSALRMETTSAILDSLGLKTTDLERAQEAFSGLWHEYDFRVKTFQEGLGLTGINLGVLGNKVVPNYSSLIGDHREHAETIQANHMDMCRFTGADDPNYRKVAGEIRSVYRSIKKVNRHTITHYGGGVRRQDLMHNTDVFAKEPGKVNEFEFNDDEQAYLQSLWFPSMNNRHQSLEQPADQTCLWLFEDGTYLDWLHNRNQEQSCGLLCLKGKPGVGKSILMKEAFRRATLEQSRSDYITAAFFFNAKGDELEHSPVGVYRSLLYQLLPRHRDYFKRFRAMWVTEELRRRENGELAVALEENKLQIFLRAILGHKTGKRLLIYIDALDECDSSSIQSHAYFWRSVTKSAHAEGVNLNVCLASRHFPSITISDCPGIYVELHNGQDIVTYVEQRFQLGIATKEPRWKLLRDKILTKSAGVFLWVVLVVDDVLKKWEDGRGMQFLLKQLDVVPNELETLFCQLFQPLDEDERLLAVRFFQWAILAAKPLRLYEWHHILAFIKTSTPSSLREWRLSDDFTETDEQLERRIKSISRGLVEVKTVIEATQKDGFETMSMRAGAGSLDLEQGNTRVVQVIHESVREFFLHNRGFAVLHRNFATCPIGDGHLSIMATCLDYLRVTELDALIQARNRAEEYLSFASNADLPKPSKSTENGGDGAASSLLIPSLPSGSAPATTHKAASVSSLKGRMKAGEAAAVAMLNNASEMAQHMRILQWMATNHSVVEQISLDESAPNHPSHRSMSGRSQIMEDYPALLSYATFELFTHAQLAEENGADPKPIISFFEEKFTWDRWVTLREDLPRGIDLLDYVTNLGLRTWIHHLRENEDDVPLTPSINPFTRPRRRTSVASFGSAGSHTGRRSLDEPRRNLGNSMSPIKPKKFKGTIGICALDSKARSKPSSNILNRLVKDFDIRIFGDKIILDEDIENWPVCDFLISFYSDGFPLDKAISYVQLRRPFCVNDLPMQKVLADRRLCLSILDKLEIPTPRRVIVDRSGGPKVASVELANMLKERTGLSLGGPNGTGGSIQSPKSVRLSNGGNTLVVDGKKLTKPFLEKPMGAENHNITLYYYGGGGRRLFQPVNNKSSERDDALCVPKVISDLTSSYIYEEFLETENSDDVQAYTVGPHYCYAETRKSPTVDGILEVDRNGKEIRYATRLHSSEKLLAARISNAFGQRVCQLNILRTKSGSYVNNVNGWSLVRGNKDYYDKTAQILRQMFEKHTQ